MDTEINDQLKKTYLTLFERNPSYGTPENITQEGCLALAKCGAEVWNCWRHDFPVRQNKSGNFENYANFEGVDFSQPDRPTLFLHFIFGDCCNFVSAKFSNDIIFMDAHFGEYADFSNSKFNHVNFKSVHFGRGTLFIHVRFAGAKFKWCTFENVLFDFCDFGPECVDFSESVFHGYSSFTRVNFGFHGSGVSIFHNVTFHSLVDFRGSRFGAARFSVCTWMGLTHFEGIQCTNDMLFTNNTWHNKVDFTAVRINESIVFTDCDFLGDADFTGRSLDELVCLYHMHYFHEQQEVEKRFSSIAPNEFNRIYFQGCNFENELFFRNRIFKNVAHWVFSSSSIQVDSSNEKPRATSFKKIPIFHGAKLCQDTSFADTIFPEATGHEANERAYRTLKQAFEQYKATREEARFFRLEMGEEICRLGNELEQYKYTKWLKKEAWYHAAISWYKKFNYGFSIEQPIKYIFALFVSMMMVSIFCLAYLNQLSFFLPMDWQKVVLVIQYSFSSVLPFLGIDRLSNDWRLTLFGNGLPYQLITFIETFFVKPLSTLCLFLLGLALRNNFKMK